MARSRSSHRWLKEHFDDEFVRRAQAEGWRSRAVYKLQEINERDRLLKPGTTLVDLGAAPGGWSQYAARALGERGRVLALDILPMDALAGVDFIQGDFREETVFAQLLATLAGTPVDLVISDMAPNTSGLKAVDQPKQMYLVELALDFARQTLRPGGDFLVKVFQGEGFDALLKDLRADFGSVATRKPKASRARSAELYLLARNFRS
ncbi:23S rRNA (uridine(2552)-2'-O)-methyltransferase RlmE [Plasticicumulans sp.]|uniref:23S rRNA (uridine(2552)-2'-O)-methyltransferase RlmE n=1 Tax=Plasticicumulans sp. TaxID=2307179 RepID=UPI002D0413CE|nr:23S rRNA (uridine(2552)-2'-O)-methyltransferase RlmE [Plasticicumulans sp.]HNJ84650.1 23S rRNA (uridine(2552)-2'-O)-methyltransferase RlmE [Piscinibacter sp.]HMV37618.1 23S rRNA (uridine(2552)-2'-O)-methyltransferase RlmE [Plasticicumulans sp.]HMW28430.1 23S rRNA (uridine(2552)-2'-O)-methyltransferase RlmE [Plasticicumulans sp.]HND97094.1 23S rRNA (uridine(2552)-2'-O)-methyltransferase RlmE [Plasticicumulans sp.]HNE00643.1 23S rRNA (uridine(2552)-2'-O)-methyltransferase RlmE [Plasticicumula